MTTMWIASIVEAQAALAAAREEGRREERKRCAKIARENGDGQINLHYTISQQIAAQIESDYAGPRDASLATAREEGRQAGIRAVSAEIMTMPVVYNIQMALLNICDDLLNSPPPAPTSPPAAPSPPNSK